MKVHFKSLWAVLAMALVALSSVHSESTTPPPGIRENTPRVHALTHARIVTTPGQIVEDGILVLRDGNIVAVGSNAPIPADARVWDMSGKTIYPGFVDLYSDYGIPKPEKRRGPGSTGGEGGPPAQAPPPAPSGSPYWNAKITPQRSAAEMFVYDEDGAEELRGQGIVLALSVPQGNIISGTGAFVNTGDGTGNRIIERPDAVLHVRFTTESESDDYPGSLMGLIALLRQSYLDAEWYTKAQAAWAVDHSLARPEQNEALARLAELKLKKVPAVLEAKDEQAFLREANLATELGLTPIMRGSNYEYKRLDAVKATALPVILPLDFPKTPSVKTPEEALEVDFDDLRHWYLAPENAKRLNEAGVAFAFTANGLKEKKEFLKQVRTTVERGLSRDAALAALTSSPAAIGGIANRYGTLVPGKAASFVVTDGELFEDKTNVLETWVDGNRYEVKSQPDSDPRGTWDVKLTGEQAQNDQLTLELKGERGAPSGAMKKGAEAKLANVEMSGLRLAFTFQGDSIGYKGTVQMGANVQSEFMIGNGVWPDGRTFTWNARRTGAFQPEADTTKKKALEPLKFGDVFPQAAFGMPAPPARPKNVAVTNATIWTSGPQGVIPNGTLLVSEGKIVGVGANVKVPSNALVVDAHGMHVTPGIIDCHSHTAIDGDVNESNQTITAEVRIGDVVSANDVSIYRQLAGGVTAANLLHGSANAIGGHNQVIKFRWGATPEDMKFKAAPPGIKFALGENPKQSNWGERFTTRYPQTRMGVEQIIRDDFQAAREYEQRWKVYNKNPKGIPPRRDLELDAVVEVLNGQRLVHAHSYRQDEIEMLMRLAEEYGFRIATFQHVLEGYKVADLMAAHGAGGSCFSDWWAYKFEVYDAIPYNGGLMHDEGVVVSFNSDSDELARHLNTEAAKAVKYGSVPPEEALKFVTLNPAKQLRIDDRVGSLEVGKDADFAVWSGDPLSNYSLCLQTWIDGQKYFDRDEDLKMRDQIRTERAQLVQHALQEGGSSEGDGPPRGGRPHHSCHEEFEEE